MGPRAPLGLGPPRLRPWGPRCPRAPEIFSAASGCFHFTEERPQITDCEVLTRKGVDYTGVYRVAVAAVPPEGAFRVVDREGAVAELKKTVDSSADAVRDNQLNDSFAATVARVYKKRKASSPEDAAASTSPAAPAKAAAEPATPAGDEGVEDDLEFDATLDAGSGGNPGAGPAEGGQRPATFSATKRRRMASPVTKTMPPSKRMRAISTIKGSLSLSFVLTGLGQCHSRRSDGGRAPLNGAPSPSDLLGVMAWLSGREPI